ncbi:MAG: helix-turn-helix domain-containing protein [Firmicutes bacterium]|nr:helix-turn-helix domain-containing protein [Bacillota bacterium]
MKQTEKIYMISDAAKQVQVESHVLRYWEEELQMPAKRNEMGHRYYTEEDIKQFRKIKELKEQGLQLKAIRHMLKSGNLQMVVMPQAPEEVEMDMGKRHVVMVKKGEFLPVNEHPAAVQEESREQKSLRLQQLLRDMIVEAVQSSNQELCREVKESLLKELDYQFRLQEEKEDIREEERIGRQEEHYRQIDELLRTRSGKVHMDKKKMFEGWLKKPKKKAEKEK